MTRMIFLAAAIMVLAANSANSQSLPGTGVKNTRHDARNWMRSVEVCNICHTPHNGSTNGPLWSHATTTATYTLYASPTLNAVPGQPGAQSKLCLSCHDGTIAINNFIGHGAGSITTKLGGGANYTGTDLSNDHPIGITYDTALAVSDGKLADPAAKNVTIGSVVTKNGTLAELMLVNGRLECTSCHDVHNRYTVGINKFLVKVDVARSELCLVCHNK